MTDTNSTAVISECGKYRYHLSRHVGPEGKECLFIMLNPSTADATEDDPTIRRCMAYAKTWGCGTMHVCNLFAYRATDPSELYDAVDPVGPDNRDHIVDTVRRVKNYGFNPGPIVCAWGNHGSFMDQSETVLGWLEDENCKPSFLKMNGTGQPAHPLYLKKDLVPQDFTVSKREEG